MVASFTLPRSNGKMPVVERTVIWPLTATPAALSGDALKIGASDFWCMHHDTPSVFAGHYDPFFRWAFAKRLMTNHGSLR